MPRLITTPRETFASFGPSIVPTAARRKCELQTLPEDRLEVRAMLRAACPREPGVYGMLDNNDRLVYVGKSKSLRNRLLSYFAKTPSHEKVVRLIRQSKRVVWEPISHELLALIREQELITRWTPTFNRQGQPLKRQPAFLCISNGGAPHVYATSRISQRVASWYGPIHGSGKASAAALSLNYAFALRDCPDRTSFSFNEQLELFPILKTAQCLRHELGSCLGPCAAGATRGQYNRQLEQAKRFLEGTDVGLLDRLQVEMEAAARSRVFEKAAILRDQIDALAWLDRRLADLRTARNDLHAVYPLPGFGKRRIWLLLNSSFLADAVVVPHDAKSASHLEKKLVAAGKRNHQLIPADTHAVLLQLIIVSWFRNRKGEKELLIDYQNALSKMQDLPNRQPKSAARVLHNVA